MLFFLRARRVSASSSGLSSTSRMVSFVMLLSSSQGEIEGCPVVHGTLGPGATPVPMDDPLHRGQSDPGTRELVHPVQPLKRTKQLIGMGHVKPDPVIAHKVRRGAAIPGCTKLDP